MGFQCTKIDQCLNRAMFLRSLMKFKIFMKKQWFLAILEVYKFSIFVHSEVISMHHRLSYLIHPTMRFLR